jgi:hypothetical protein
MFYSNYSFRFKAESIYSLLFHLLFASKALKNRFHFICCQVPKFRSQNKKIFDSPTILASLIIFLPAAEFYGVSGRNVLPGVGNTAAHLPVYCTSVQCTHYFIVCE